MTKDVKFAGSGDLEAAYALHKASFSPGSPDFYTLAGFRALAEEKNSGLIVFPEGKTGVSGYILYRIIGDEAELLSMAVEESRRNQGIGAKLLSAMLADLKERGVKALFLEVSEENRAAQALYEAFGATTVGARKNYYNDPKSGKKNAVIKKFSLR